ncbi:G2/mitotic-specific cyclin-2-like isoform X1 [Andrographis paniculata]|uniref:G2/mitotic-specific cyclin-2-like isoform X1 n=1 Tax=Andrographis paniculata TaxID=175694 RepID=UPI0021E98C80|nr:G2/mitotic-specific cyclin-2-like isoform X1 [Andrographis paniculata]XP_051140326.1 G2/mitotic-specific cyclin-2-like isoform X1 [Andrographis paniculata]
MFASDENSSAQIRPSDLQGEGRRFGAEMRPNRRALSVINHSNPYPPCVVNKRGFAETNVISGKNIGPLPGQHRPITRKCAAHKGVSNPSLEEAKKPRTSSFTVWEDVPLDDHGAAKGQPAPMSLEQQSEVEMVDKNQMVCADSPIDLAVLTGHPPSVNLSEIRQCRPQEVEMEDIFEEEEAVVDIDAADKSDPLAVVDYIEELYSYYKKIEMSSCVSPEYMMHQFDINERMRAILVDWLIEVHHKFELRGETLFLTINLIDRFLAKQSVVRKKLQLVGLVAMLLACKYEEVSVPVVDDLVFISDKAYTRKEVLEMEKMMLNALQFNMSVPTPYVFMRRFLKAAQSDKKLELVAFYLIELSLVEYEAVKYPPSLLAAAAVYAAQATVYGVAQWSRTCEWHTGYTAAELQECTRLMVALHGKAAAGKLTGVHRKYNTNKFGYAARCEPADHLLLLHDDLQQ